MPIEQISRYLRAQPFRAFRLVTTDGEAYEIYHPEFCLPGRGVIVVGRASKGKMDAEEILTISLLHVVRIETLEPAESAR